MAQITTAPNATVADRRDLAETLGVDDTGDGDGELTWGRLAGAIEPTTEPAFASRGEAIRAALDGKLDPDLIERERERLVEAIDRLPDVREVGIPDGTDGPYTEIAEPGWRLYDHLLEVGFFESLEEHALRFEPEYITATTRELVRTESLGAALGEAGFDEDEKIALLTAVANNDERLSRWVPSNQIPEGVEYDTSNVPPLHRRAMGGALLWIDGLDRHLWQYEPLVTDEILDDAVRHVKGMLGGIYVTATAALDLADDETDAFTDEGLVAAFTAGAAIQIVEQEDVLHDVFYITDEMRAPSELREETR
ncbi:hypothetical protein [Halopiger aswanensis]|uniref:Uncharacterized protein n=1 Tax=Halopiger aswanensis TaxID=148449 RepID=A0A3R7EEH9_9EURY|nr:hypothetical protein [Halopiger aswanensis]RKD94838.1 hypothetical protein ATJ93_1681 [Halopiger aswanensis]